MSNGTHDPERKQLESKKADLLLKIRELELELQRTNNELFRKGVDLHIAMCW